MSDLISEASRRTLPPGWRWVRVGDVCQTSSGGTPPRGISKYYGGSIPWVKSGELNDGLVSYTKETITEEGLANSSAKVFPAGTLMIALYGATIGKLGILQMNAATNQAVCAIFPSRGVNTDYIFLYLLVEKAKLIKISAGGAQPNISQDIVKDIEIPLPPTLADQQRIAATLRECLAAVEQARAATAAQLAAANALPAAYLRQIFASDEAADWRWVRLGEVCDFSYGSGLPSGVRQSGTVPVYGSNGIVGYHNRPLTSGPTIIIGRKGSIGAIHFSPVACWPIDTTYYIENTKLNADLAWLVYILQTVNLSGLNKAAAVPGLNREDAYKIEIPLPPTLADQQRIAATLRERLAAVDQLRARLQAQLASINQLPAALLRQAFNGEL